MTETLNVFGLILATSFVFSAICARIPGVRIPSSISYLIFGIILHLSRIPLPASEIGWINHLGKLGLWILMFLSGLEVDMSLLRRPSGHNGTHSALKTAITVFCGTLLFSFGLCLVLSRWMPQPAHPYMLSLLFATTSLGVIVPVLEETGLLQSEYGQTLLVSALVADVATMFLVSLFVSVHTAGRLFDLLMSMCVIPGSWLLYVLVRWVQRQPSARRWAGDEHARIRGIIALLVSGCAVADFTGAEPILGGFLAGIMVSAIPFAMKSTIVRSAKAMGYGFFVPLFFLTTGLNLPIRLLANASQVMWIPVFIVLSVIIKLMATWPLRKQFGHQQATAGGILLSSRLSLVLATANIGVAIDAMSVTVANAVTIAAVLTCLLAPIVFVSMSQH